MGFSFETQSPLDPSHQARFRGYVTAKARMLREMGVDRYRKEDFFDQPSVQLDDDELEGLMKACVQIHRGLGFSVEAPLEGVLVASCYGLIAAFHFKVAGRRSTVGSDGITHEMRCRHRVATDMEGAVFNRVQDL